MFLGMLALIVLQSPLLNTQSANPPPTSGNAMAWYLPIDADSLPPIGSQQEPSMYFQLVCNIAEYFYTNVSVILPLQSDCCRPLYLSLILLQNPFYHLHCSSLALAIVLNCLVGCISPT